MIYLKAVYLECILSGDLYVQLALYLDNSYTCTFIWPNDAYLGSFLVHLY